MNSLYTIDTRNFVLFLKYLCERHTHVAYLINQGVQPLIIKERLGHKDIKITLNTYGHLYPSQQKQVAEMLNLQRQNKSPNGGNR